MRFNSPVFFCFLLLVVTGLWLLPVRMRRTYLLIASYVFYGSWHYPYLVLLIGVAALNHWGAIWITAASDRARRGAWILAANVALLAMFKYLDWMAGNVNLIAHLFRGGDIVAIPGWVLPLGISFYIFEGISYTVDVIRRRERVHSFWDFQLFIAFFPKLIAGPILRGKELLPQIEQQDRRLDVNDAFNGIWLLVTGLFLKTVVADGFAPLVDDAFARPAASLGALDIFVMAIAFGLQIYFDFSSYSRLAIGAARLCGIRLVDNFDFPFNAVSPVDFWNRWHMSLSRWIRDYLFVPLVGTRTTLAARCLAAMMAMTLCGVWHGAGWTFVAWGAYHGLLIAGYHVVTSRRPSVARAATAPSPARSIASGALTFGLVSFGWLFFRSSSLMDALHLALRALQPWHTFRALSGTLYLQTAVVLAAVWLAPTLSRRWTAFQAGASLTPVRATVVPLVQGVALGLMVVLSLIYLRGQTAFIYFQF